MRTIRTVLVLALLGLAACSPARTGVTGNTLTTNIHPPVSMTAGADFALHGSGTLWVNATSMPRLMNPPLASLGYAVFSRSQSGPVTESAHAFILHLQDAQAWRFAPDSWPLYQSLGSPRSMGEDSVTWTSRILRVPARGDWISDAWLAAGREVPEFWIAKRWASLQSDSIKTVLEYREPWPASFESFDSLDLLLGGVEAQQDLQGFLARAGKAFTVSREYTPLPRDGGGKSMLLPAAKPDTAQLIGDVAPVDRGSETLTWH